METNSSVNGQGSLGRVAPRLLLVICLADIGLRLERVDPLTFRAWEALTTYRPPGAPFERNRRYYNARSYGDLAAMGNLPALRQYRPEAFTTDPLGFRNPGDVASGPVAAIVVGDSFAVGSAVNDDENLTARLSALMGCRLYNAGASIPIPIGFSRWLASSTCEATWSSTNTTRTSRCRPCPRSAGDDFSERWPG